MATPILTRLAATTKTIYLDNAQVVDFGIVKDVNGDPIDIDTGYTAKLRVRPGTDSHWQNFAEQSGTWSYGSDGALKLTTTLAQSINEGWPGTHLGEVIVSNDSFSTYSTHFNGKVTYV